jgi:lysophospholipase L1-like esterase
MNKSVFLSLLIFLCISLSFMPVQKIKVIFFGDSITEAAVNPGGFIALSDSLLNPKGSDNYELIGAGVSGNKVYDLYFRVDDDVISRSPDMVVIWVGVNDVWHKRSSGTGTDADKFEKFYKGLIKKFKESHIRVIVCTPATIGEKWDNTNEQDGDLNKYSDIIRHLAKSEQLTLVDMRAAFETYEKTNNPGNLDHGILTADGVHLNAAGNRFVAKLMTDAIRNTP